MEVDAIATLLERGGLPGLIVAALLLAWRFAPDRKAPEPAQQMVEALRALTEKVDALADDVAETREQTIDRLARVETEVKNLKERK